MQAILRVSNQMNGLIHAKALAAKAVPCRRARSLTRKAGLGLAAASLVLTTLVACERSLPTAEKRAQRFVALLIEQPDKATTLNALCQCNAKAIEEALLEGLAFDAIYAQSDSMAVGARLALKGAGIDPKTIPTVGIDYISEARAAIRSGEQSATFVYPTVGREGAEYAVKILLGETVPKVLRVPSQMVTKDNVDNVAPIF